MDESGFCKRFQYFTEMIREENIILILYFY